MVLSCDEHGVAETEEAVAFVHGDLIGVQDLLPACQRGDQHDQGTFGKVKVRDQCVDTAEVIAGIDKNVGPARLGLQKTVFIGKALERAARSGSYGDHAAAVFPAAVDTGGGFLGDDAEFGMHLMVFDFGFLDGAEGAETHMQGDGTDRDALPADLVKQRFGKVKTGRRGGGAAELAGIDGLIALAVVQLRLDVRGKRHFAETVEDFQKYAVIKEADTPVSVGQDGLDAGAQLVFSEENLRTLTQMLSRAAEAFPAVIPEIAEQNQLADAAGGTMTQKTGGEHARVVDDQTVAGTQEGRQIIEKAMLKLAGFAVETEKARVVALRNRRLRNQLRRKIVIKIACFHMFFGSQLSPPLEIGHWTAIQGKLDR